MQEIQTNQQSTLQTPIEIALGIDENNMTTARKLYEFLGMDKSNYSRWVRNNVTENQFAEENIDYLRFVFNDETPTGGIVDREDFKLTSRFAKKLSMMQKNERGEEARDYFTHVEEKAKEMAINRSQLSPQMQMLMGMVETQARQELEQKRQAEQLNRIEEKQNMLAETFRKPSDKEDFKAWCKKCISRITKSPMFGLELSESDKYKLAWSESYERLNKERPCRLKQRVKTAQGDALQHGLSPSKAKEINQLTIIANDKDLKPIYEKVIKDMMMAYCID